MKSESQIVADDPMSVSAEIRKKYLTIENPEDFSFIESDETILQKNQIEIFYMQKNPFTKEEKITRAKIIKEPVNEPSPEPTQPQDKLQELEDRILAIENQLNQ